MVLSLPRAFVEFILLGPITDRRQLQDSPMLGDVWLAFAKAPDQPLEVLITPDQATAAGEVATAIDARIIRAAGQPLPDVAPLHGIVAASLYFEEVLQFVVPMSVWWHRPGIQAQLKEFLDEDHGPGRLNRVISALLETARSWGNKGPATLAQELLPAFDRYLALCSLILWARKQEVKAGEAFSPATPEALGLALANVNGQKLSEQVLELLDKITSAGTAKQLVWQVSLNRPAVPALERSVPSVKADAARTLFNVNCGAITWAVVDSGIKGDHDAFGGKQQSRVQKSFDFSTIRKIVSLDNLKANPQRDVRITELLGRNLAKPPSRKAAIKLLTELAADAKLGRPIQWDLVTPLVEIKPDTEPPSDHGTHVAGIIGASKKALPAAVQGEGMDGMCPDIRLYDFRVLNPLIEETEFAIIAALQYIRYLNSRTEYMSIHGANLSLSIPHDVRNYACGRTPICLECERLVESGIFVVAAAGNLGYQSFTTRDGSYEGYAAFSITDPGNADGVLTVGATHRYAPHTYGVSFFSSRGPTGDGRPKPDLVAPGERIRAPFRQGWGDLDGTSMAAPHASGAAAMLMARYTELVGQPRRIKRILCESATDLGRERSFQGSGMIDVLRAFQSI